MVEIAVEIAVERKARGRPRSENINLVILEAVLDTIAEEGITKVTMEGVAQRAGVSKASLYRRFPTKWDMAQAAVEHMRAESPNIPESGSAYERLLLLMEVTRTSIHGSRYGRIMLAVISHSHENPKLAQLVYDRILQPRRMRVREILEQGMKSGEFPTSLNIDVAMPTLIGPMLYLGMWSMCDPVSQTSTEDVLRSVLGVKRLD
ncbi:MAG: TetR/AcrR family transcriptional regulator [Actinomycetia bacterium]|nr:TetR/AcrR family transcriptional regulator [Actinomycetes bacterium]